MHFHFGSDWAAIQTRDAGGEVIPDVLQVPPELKSRRVSWMRGEWCDMRGLVCMLKQLLSLFF